ncbi:DUF2577 domain-containing protein [Paenibacillus enshidis]|uniref:DUF2577 domain-containing protein n=1 Tax=Paenibacillus enshidis TaxID=1458439 RepID=A0ABV5AT76_9BACL
MLDIIKKASLGAVSSANPVHVLFGSVVGTNPLEINIDQRFTLPRELLILPESVVNQEWESGDKVLLLRVQGGERYVILDRVVDES